MRGILLSLFFIVCHAGAVAQDSLKVLSGLHVGCTPTRYLAVISHFSKGYQMEFFAKTGFNHGHNAIYVQYGWANSQQNVAKKYYHIMQKANYAKIGLESQLYEYLYIGVSVGLSRVTENNYWTIKGDYFPDYVETLYDGQYSLLVYNIYIGAMVPLHRRIHGQMTLGVAKGDPISGSSPVYNYYVPGKGYSIGHREWLALDVSLGISYKLK